MWFAKQHKKSVSSQTFCPKFRRSVLYLNAKISLRPKYFTHWTFDFNFPPCLSNSSFHTSPAADCLLFHLNSGRFSHSSAVSCDAVHVLAFGRSSWDSDSGSPTVGQTINFACDEGLVLAGASAIVCQENGTYDNQPPLCLSECNRSLLFVSVLFTPQQK